MTADAGKPGRPKTAVCPVCGKPTAPAHRPFCSKRCAEIDLGRWLKGAYAVPGEPVAKGRGGIGGSDEDEGPGG